MAERSYRVLFWCLALIGLTADQASKYGVFAWLSSRPGNAYVLFESQGHGGFQFVAQFDPDGDGKLRPHVNHGALFGFLRQHKTLANATFAVISLLAALAIIGWSFLGSTARDAWLCASLGLILGGTLGNLYDRVMFNGVRDFLHWFYLFDWPVFNIADVCLVCGAGLLLIQAFFGQQVLDSNTSTAPVPPAPGIVPTEVPSVR
jgi:lipoprotein signal peptidase